MKVAIPRVYRYPLNNLNTLNKEVRNMDKLKVIFDDTVQLFSETFPSKEDSDVVTVATPASGGGGGGGS